MPEFDDSGRALMARIARQDRSALAEFYRDYHGRVFGYLYRLTGNPAQAEDLLQEVMLVVWQKAGTFRSDGRAASWVFGIAHNLAMSAFRRERGGQALAWDDVAEVAGDEPPLEDEAIRQATTDALRTGLERLTPEHRAVLELAFYQDFSGKEIAAIMGVAEGTVKSRLSYARRALKAVLLCEREGTRT